MIWIAEGASLQKASSNQHVQAKNQSESASKVPTSPISICKCKNGGICVLDNDFCVCDTGFTGRYCEFNLSQSSADQIENQESDQDYEYERKSETFKGCGTLMNGETEYLNCAKCTCTDQMLLCTALSKENCQELKLLDENIYQTLNNLLKQNEYNIQRLKGLADLNVLIQLANYIETYAYEIYIKDYQTRFGKEFSVIEQIVDEEHLKISSLDQKQTSSNYLVIFKSSRIKSSQVLGLYFGQIDENDSPDQSKETEQQMFLINSSIRLHSFYIADYSLFFIFFGAFYFYFCQ
jgi:hypothetical protein